MARNKPTFLCTACGVVHNRWEGRCSSCGEFNTIEEVDTRDAIPVTPRANPLGPKSRAMADIAAEDTAAAPTGEQELDRVLGGGIRGGGVYLLGGPPGIGKSTLALSLAATFQGPALYVSGEEAPGQVKERLQRLDHPGKGLRFQASGHLDDVLEEIAGLSPGLVVLDSIQTIATGDVPSGAGSVAQVRECGGRLTAQAKAMGHALVLIGHVTKEGQLAGPRTLEHLVDAVLYFEGEDRGVLRLLRAFKNRFGSTNEVGLFEMTRTGLQGVGDAADYFLKGRTVAPGSVVTVAVEGLRPLILEIQALTNPSGYATPRRTVTGMDPNRVAMVAAVMERHLGLRLGDQDLFVNVTGGVRLTDTSADLPVALAIWSSFHNKSLPAELVGFGELGLTGEVRAVAHTEKRLKEAAQLGFTTALCPQPHAPAELPEGLSLLALQHLSELAEHLP